MSRGQLIPVEESVAEWRKDPEYVKAYNALEDEFSLAAEMIRRASRQDGEDNDQPRWWWWWWWCFGLDAGSA